MSKFSLKLTLDIPDLKHGESTVVSGADKQRVVDEAGMMLGLIRLDKLPKGSVKLTALEIRQVK